MAGGSHGHATTKDRMPALTLLGLSAAGTEGTMYRGVRERASASSVYKDVSSRAYIRAFYLMAFI